MVNAAVSTAKIKRVIMRTFLLMSILNTPKYIKIKRELGLNVLFN
jgi:hypothetical protein